MLPGLQIARCMVVAGGLGLMACGSDPFYGAPPAGNPDGHCQVPLEALPEEVGEPKQVVGDGSPETCTSEALAQAVKNGGIIRFNCGAQPVTITVKETLDLSDVPAALTVLDGENRIALSGGGVRRVLFMDSCRSLPVSQNGICSGKKLVLQNMTITDGNASGIDSQCGGALYMYGGQLTIVNSRFFRNKCNDSRWYVGGAIYVEQRGDITLNISHSTFGGADRYGNQANSAGAIGVFGSRVNIYNSLMSHNAAVGSSYSAQGGALLVRGSSQAFICGNTITNNASNGAAGAIAFIGSDYTARLRLSQSQIQENSNKIESEGYPGIWVPDGKIMNE